MDCWGPCAGQGKCLWCGTLGLCCTKNPGWTDKYGGCDGTVGGSTGHECVMPRMLFLRSISYYLPNIMCKTLVLFQQYPYYFHVLATLQNEGVDCWLKCGGQGLCSWCGTRGMCCTKKPGWLDYSNGCDGTFGGPTQHECVLQRK